MHSSSYFRGSGAMATLTAEQLSQMGAFLGIEGGAEVMTTPEGVLRALFKAVEMIHELKSKPGNVKSEARGLEDLISTKGIISSDKFGGTDKPSMFRAWAYTFKATIKSKDRELAQLMEMAEGKSNAGTKMLSGGGDVNTDDLVKKNQTLHAILVNVVVMDSEPFKILENHDSEGLECWRLFHRRWNRVNPMSSIDVTEAIRKIDRAKNIEEILPKIEDHRKLILDWERLRSRPDNKAVYPDIDLKADYTRIIPDKWVQKLKLDHDLHYETCTAAELLNRIEEYIRTFSDTSAPMEIGMVDQSSEKDAKEGAREDEVMCSECFPQATLGDCGCQPLDYVNKSGNQYLNPNIQCWLCGAVGHPRSKCPKGKGKGDIKGQYSKGGGKKGNPKGQFKGQPGGFKGYYFGQAYGKGDKGYGKGYGKGPIQPWMTSKGKGKGSGPMDLGSMNYFSDYPDATTEMHTNFLGSCDWAYNNWPTTQYETVVPIFSLEKSGPEVKMRGQKVRIGENGWNEVVKVHDKLTCQQDQKVEKLKTTQFFGMEHLIHEDTNEDDDNEELEIQGQRYVVLHPPKPTNQAGSVDSKMRHKRSDRKKKNRTRKSTQSADNVERHVQMSNCELKGVEAPDLQDSSSEANKPDDKHLELCQSEVDYCAHASNQRITKDLESFEIRYPECEKCIDQVGIGANDWFSIPGGITIDSGAAESVIPRDMCQNYPTVRGMQQQMGVYYVTANGEEMENEGEKHLKLTTPQGKSKSMVFQVTDVTKPLGSVSRICSSGQQVVFNPPGHPDGSYIRNLQTGDRTPLREENGTYRLHAWVNPYIANDTQGFPRRGQ